MAYLGASGKTAQEMADVFKYPVANQWLVADNFKKIIAAIEKEDGLQIANKMYVKRSYKFKSDFKNKLDEHFKSTLESIDFSERDQAANSINSWVEKRTSDRMKNLLSPDSLDDTTRAVLVNTIYFKGKWKYQFDRKKTREDEFWVTPDHSIQVDMMFIKKKFRYARLKELDATAIELPYLDSDITMLIIVPQEKDGLRVLESRLNEVSLAEIDSKLSIQEVNLYLPRFQFEYEVRLNDVLKKMGIKEAFDPESADFSKLLDSNDRIHVSEVIHKAYINVDEEGAKTASAMCE